MHVPSSTDLPPPPLGVVLVVSCVVWFSSCSVFVCVTCFSSYRRAMSTSKRACARFFKNQVWKLAGLDGQSGSSRSPIHTSHLSILRRFVIQRGHEHTRTGN